MVAFQHVISGAATALMSYYMYQDEKQENIGKVMVVALTALSFVGSGELAARSIRSAHTFGLMRRAVAQVAGGVVGTFCLLLGISVLAVFNAKGSPG